MIHKQPGLVIHPESIDEVAAAVNLARQQRLLFSIKGGGYNVAGLSLADRGVTLDMSRMRDVRALPSCSKPRGEQLDVGPFHLKQPQVVGGAPDQPLTQVQAVGSRVVSPYWARKPAIACRTENESTSGDTNAGTTVGWTFRVATSRLANQ